MSGNDFVKIFLRTPLHVFLGDTMLITVTGCKTGKKYPTPVGFYRQNGDLWVLTNRDRTWWRNIKKGADVSLLLKGKPIKAYAQTELDEKQVEAHLVEYIQKIPMAAKPMGIRIESTIPNAEDIRRVARDRLFVKVTPCSP